jgi:hypothetical protein
METEGLRYSKIARSGERSICVDDPVDDHLLKRGFIKPLDQ